MEPIYLSIEPEKTGKKIKKLLDASGYTVRDVQHLMGFNNPQAIYKWLSGKSLPSIDNFVILSRLLHTSIDNLLVVDGEVVVLYGVLAACVDMPTSRFFRNLRPGACRSGR